MQELDHWGRRRIHNLKYCTWIKQQQKDVAELNTWIEQQQKDVAELNAQWYEYATYWPARWRMASYYGELITELNTAVGG